MFHRPKTREDKFNAYLVGEGILSSPPRVDHNFFHLAGVCAGASWHVSAGHGQMPRDKTNDLEDAANGDGTTESTVIGTKNDGDDEENIKPLSVDSAQNLFCAKKDLPYPIYQETYSKWKGAVDMILGIRRVRRKKCIYIQPLNEFPTFLTEFRFIHCGASISFFRLIEEFAKRFFLGLDVRVLGTVSTDSWKVKERIHSVTGEKQLLASDLNARLNRLLPRDGHAIIGVSWTDLYPSEKLNFVLGETSAILHTATFSFGRYETKLFEKCGRPPEITTVDGALIWKALKVFTHETCHTFFISHCVFFDCLMNESSSIAEAMNQPMFLCPVCLRKLQKVCRFRVKPWHVGVRDFLCSVLAQFPYEMLSREVAWLDTCLETLATIDLD